MKADFAEWPCSLARTVDVFGDSWTLLIVRDAAQGLTRFDEFQRSLNVARNTLSDRLGRLVDTGIMTKRFYQDNPPRYEYLLTDKGRDFFPVLTSMLAWGDRWLDGGAGAPVVLHHREPDHKIVPRVVCAECGEPVVHSDIHFHEGPGYPDDVRPELDMRERFAPARAPVIGARRTAKPSGRTAAKRRRDAGASGSSGAGRDAGTRNAGGASTVKRARPARKRSAG